MKMSKQKVAVEENWIKGKVITGLTSAGSVSVCPGCSGVLEVFFDAFEMLLCVCVLKQKMYLYIFKQGVGVFSGCIVLWLEFSCAFRVGEHSK